MQLKPWLVPSAIGVASFGAGLAVGLSFRYKTTVYQLKGELDQAKSHIAALDNQIAAQQKRDIIKWMAGGSRPEGPIDYTKFANPEVILATNEVETEAAAPTERQTVFDPMDIEPWDWEEAKAERTTDAPYVIHRSEFTSNESGFRQSTLTWYAGDAILCDEHDTPIYNPEKVVGQLTFGRGSDDPNIVYIRNIKLEGEYEILRDSGHYALVVLGHQVEDQAEEAELRHAHQPRKFRQD